MNGPSAAGIVCRPSGRVSGAPNTSRGIRGSASTSGSSSSISSIGSFAGAAGVGVAGVKVCVGKSDSDSVSVGASTTQGPPGPRWRARRHRNQGRSSRRARRAPAPARAASSTGSAARSGTAGALGATGATGTRARGRRRDGRRGGRQAAHCADGVIAQRNAATLIAHRIGGAADHAMVESGGLAAGNAFDPVGRGSRAPRR